jgi:hypothetical protein
MQTVSSAHASLSPGKTTWCSSIFADLTRLHPFLREPAVCGPSRDPATKGARGRARVPHRHSEWPEKDQRCARRYPPRVVANLGLSSRRVFMWGRRYSQYKAKPEGLGELCSCILPKPVASGRRDRDLEPGHRRAATGRGAPWGAPCANEPSAPACSRRRKSPGGSIARDPVGHSAVRVLPIVTNSRHPCCRPRSWHRRQMTHSCCRPRSWRRHPTTHPCCPLRWSHRRQPHNRLFRRCLYSENLS